MAKIELVRKLAKFFAKNKRSIYTATNIAGCFVTTGFAVEAGYRTNETVRQMRAEAGDKANDIPKMEYVKRCAPHFIPTVASLAITTASGIAAGRTANKQIAASAAAAAASDIAYKELRDAVKEKIGEKKTAEIQAEIAQNSVAAHPPVEKTIVVTNYGTEIIQDEYHPDIYFYGCVDRIERVQNDMNARILRELYVTWNEVYMELGLKPMEFGNEIGWTPDNMIDFRITSAIDDNGRPVIVLGHHNRPVSIHSDSLNY